MKTLIIKLGALGDVVRTTCILHSLKGDIYLATKENAASVPPTDLIGPEK